MIRRPYIIGISGGSGSGKTTFLNALRASFPVNEVCFISLDDYYRPRETQKLDAAGIRNFDLPESIEVETLRRDLNRLIAGETIEKTEYAFNNELAQPGKKTFHPAPVIVIEGLFIYHYPRIRELFDLKLFIHAEDNYKLIRRIKRDQKERNYPVEDVVYRYEKHVMPSYDKYIRPYMAEADLVINNNSPFSESIKVIKTFIRTKIS